MNVSSVVGQRGERLREAASHTSVFMLMETIWKIQLEICLY